MQLIINIFLSLVLLGALGSVKGEDECYYTGWNFEDKQCSEETTEMYKEERPNGQTIRFCCHPDYEFFDYYKYQATACRVTKCSVGGSPDLCTSFEDRYVNDTRLEYEEILRAPCTRFGRMQGMAGYCCVRGSFEAKLASQLGAEQNEFPHMAKLKPSDCGGTIYNKKFVISAAHCVVDGKTKKVEDVSNMFVILGTNIGDLDSKEYKYKVKRVIVHPGYSHVAGDKKDFEAYHRTFNDIALLELDRDIQFGPKIKALEIAPKGFEPKKYANQAVVVGWGTTDTMQLSIHLQKANFEIRTDKTCFENDAKKRQGPHWEYNDKKDQLLCVGGVIEGKWSPTAGGGDSGGPAICRGADGKAVLCGVTSFGGDDQQCLDNQNQEHCLPSVYADVGFFHKWIKENAGKQDPSTFYKPYLYGQPVPSGMYEHQVRITSTDGKPCGGTAIAQDVVISASHCIMNDNKERRKGVKVTTQNGKTFEIKKAAFLPGFERIGDPVDVKKQGHRVIRTDNYYKNDIVLIKLKGKMDIPPGKLAQLPESAEEPDIAFEVSRPRNSSKSNQLMQREFRILEKTECQTRLDRMARDYGEIKVDKILLCGVETYSGGSQCDRELGGGLICKGENGKDVLCGIQVFRLCEWSIPNGFINVGMFKDWAKSAMKRL